MTRPGAFTAVATNHNYVVSRNERWLPEAWLPLPSALLCQRGHDVHAEPVAVCVPRFEPDPFGGQILVDAVFRSAASNAWRLTERRQLAPSIYGHAYEVEERDGVSYVTAGILISVDLVERPLNKSARILDTTPFDEMTNAQREVQQRFDAYLAEGGGHTIDYRYHSQRTGVAAMNRLRPVVRALAGTAA